MTNPTAFTLIELLVVITIIVVLLALLTPALDKAIYQAELTVCASSMRAIGQGATMYAMNFNRRWPTVKSFQGEDDGVFDPNAGTPNMLGQQDTPSQDRRIPLREYVPVKMHADALAAGEIDYGYEQNDSDTYVSSDYDLWFGWKYLSNGRYLAGMTKLGDRWAAIDRSDRTRRFSYLVTDWDALNFATPAVQANHSDVDGSLNPLFFQNDDGLGLNLGATIVKVSLTVWTAATTVRRGPIDTNAMTDDGAVNRRRSVVTGDSHEDMEESGNVGVPFHVDSAGAPDWKRYLPAN